MATFVFVSGAWHGSWCWERVGPLLEGRGHQVLVPELLGMGADGTPLAEVTLARWADQIAEIVRAQPEPVVLVGHSRGGIVVSETAERVPDNILTSVYLAAFLLSDGMTLRGSENSPAPSYVVMGENGTSTIAEGDVGKVFYNGASSEWVARAAKRVGREPMQVFLTPVQVSAERFGRVPRAYIECIRDRAVPVAFQRQMHAALPCDPVLTLDTDHSPFYSAPEDLIDLLITIAERRRAADNSVSV
ncbi:alpha/beta fold hydrolase [Paraburkholderia hospita]|nr:alpha/beta fold hydrolase [Paraburkholderia hospita]OUL92083.1 hypothetical protein CA601_12490 [Paraburkholderia hospita]OUL92225.1 hypothetical protein CA602_03625 [Paraburkholderia hospita]